MEVAVAGQVNLGGATAVLELIKLGDEVAKILNTARTCVIEVKNHTRHDLRKIDARHDHGGFERIPHDTLPANTAEVFGSQSKSFSLGTGTEGSVTYQIGGGDARVRLRWNVPFAGGNDTDGSATGGWHGSTNFRVSAEVGVGNDARAKYELHEVGPIVFGQALGKVDAVSMIQSSYGNNFELIARTGDKLHFMWREDKPPWTWHGPHQIADGAAGNPVLIQSNFGEKSRNFELVYPDRERGIRFMWRNNDLGSMPWSAPFRFAEGLGKVDAVTMIQNRGNRNLELIARAGDKLHFMWRDRQWNGPFQIADGAAGNPVLVQSNFGERSRNFELVYPDRERGVRFMWRNNDVDSMPWSKPSRFAEGLGKVDAVTMIQNRGNRNLELIARAGDKLHFMWRDRQWNGPFHLATGAVGNVNLTQSRFGKNGNFELIYPYRDKGIRFMWRNNDM